MTRLPERLPAPLSERLASATQSLFLRQGREIDVAIGGIPFRLATSGELPYSVETVEIQRNQVDTEADPGEQTLTSWWRRSQSSWHQGAGDLYQENSDRTIDSTTFYDSSGIDVFTPGQLTLLKKMLPWTAPASPSRLRMFSSGGSIGASLIAGGDLYTSPSIGGTFSVLHNPTPTLVDGMISGSGFYSVASDGTLYEGTTASPGTATTWPLGTTPSRLLWGKHRLWVIGGRKIWQPDLSLAAGTAQNPIFTNPNQGWTYTCMAEGSSAMLFGGHDGFTSSIQSVTLDSGGGIPTLSGAAVTAAMPDGELVQELAVLAGQYVGIGTSRGFRVGTIDGNGQITYGPLIIDDDTITGCTSLAAQGRFFVVGFATTAGNAKVYRVDTGTPLDGGVFPYASDADLGFVGSVTSVASVSNTRLIAIGSNGTVWRQSSTQYVDSGWLEASRIRYRTTEPKIFKKVNVEIEPLDGQVSVSFLQEGGTELAIGNITVQGEVFADSLGISAVPMKYGAVKFYLTPGDGGTATPVVHSYAVLALPAVPPQRMITLPLLCFDREKAPSGQQYGGTTFAADRLAALQILEDAADTVLFQDFTGLDQSGQVVTIESLRFVQTSPSNIRTTGSASGAGGILVAQLRTVI